jgi:hypothetical protein
MNLGLLKTQRYNKWVIYCEVKFVPRYFMLHQFEYLHFLNARSVMDQCREYTVQGGRCL